LKSSIVICYNINKLTYLHRSKQVATTLPCAKKWGCLQMTEKSPVDSYNKLASEFCTISKRAMGEH